MDQFIIAGIDKQDPASGADFYSKVEVTLKDAEKYRTGSHLLYLVNNDGQSACEGFPLNPLSIDDNQRIPASSAPSTVTITGKNFAGKLTGLWTTPSLAAAPSTATTTSITGTDILVVDENHLKITLIPGTTEGKGKLVLEAESHLLASNAVIVNPKSI